MRFLVGGEFAAGTLKPLPYQWHKPIWLINNTIRISPPRTVKCYFAFDLEQLGTI